MPATSRLRCLSAQLQQQSVLPWSPKLQQPAAARRNSSPRFANGETGVMLVTGASSGVGKCVAAAYAAAGWRVAAVARRQAVLDDMAADPTAGGRLQGFTCDVADSTAVADMVSEVEVALGPIDVLVSNAAMDCESKPFWELEVSDIDSVIDINLKGTMYVTHAVLQSMVKRDTGHIFGVAIANRCWHCRPAPPPARSHYIRRLNRDADRVPAFKQHRDVLHVGGERRRDLGDPRRVCIRHLEARDDRLHGCDRKRDAGDWHRLQLPDAGRHRHPGQTAPFYRAPTAFTVSETASLIARSADV